MLGQIGKAPEVVVAKGMPEKAKFDGCGGLVMQTTEYIDICQSLSVFVRLSQNLSAGPLCRYSH